MDKVTMDEIVIATECSYDGIEIDYDVLTLVEELKYHVMQIKKDIEFTPRVMHALVGIDTELGEYLDVYKKHWFYHKELDHVNAAEELFDILYYVTILELVTEERYYPIYHVLDKLCQIHGTTLDKMIQVGAKKLQARYPEGFNTKKALTRDLETERAILEGL